MFKKSIGLLVLMTIGVSSCEKLTETSSISQKELSVDKASRTTSAVFCQCIKYISNRVDGSGPTGNANVMDSWLYSKGYYPVSFSASNLPRNKDIVQFKNGVHGTNSKYGHVGMIATAQKVGSSIKVTVVGANQGGSIWTEYGCNNVSMLNISSLNTGGNVVIWRK